MMTTRLLARLFFSLCLGSCVAGYAQTNPTPQSLPYSQDFSTLTHASTTYPAGWQGWKVSAGATNFIILTGPTDNEALAAGSSASTISGGVHNYNGKIGFLSSGSTNPGIVLAINTISRSNVYLNYDIMTIRNPYNGASNTRINETVLQFRVGEVGEWSILTGIEYVNNTTTQTGSGVTTPQNLQPKSILLPVECENQPIVQIRWMNRDDLGSGSRPSFAIDNIVVDFDVDNDGYLSANDCNDNDESINPSSPEMCNGFDDNCNGNIDEGFPVTTYYVDLDNDTYGSSDDAGVNYCSHPGFGYSTNNEDCDDFNSEVHPGAIDMCNGIDNDCDGSIDEDATFVNYYEDADDDGYGDMFASPIAECNPPGPGYSAINTDCDDANNEIYPGAAEICNSLDDDCNGNIDEGFPVTTYYVDLDNDTYGSSDDPGINSCSPPGPGYSTNNDDCDDLNLAVHPEAFDACNGIDNDCDGSIDEDATFVNYYADSDHDGYGDIFASPIAECNPPGPGFSDVNTDCNDANSAIHPDATEICNTLDDDCNGSVDEGLITAEITPSGSTSICKGTNITLQATEGVGLSYQWYKNGNPVPGGTGSALVVNKAGSWTVRVTAGGGCFAISDPVVTTLTVSPTAAITNMDATNDLCFDPSIKLKANGGAGYSWQWYKSGFLIGGATSAVYFATVAGNYKVMSTLNATGCSKFSPAYTIVESCRNEDESVELNEGIRVFPNPNAGTFIIQIPQSADAISADIYVYNAVGQIVWAELNINTTESVIALDNNFSSGTYFVKVLCGDEQFESIVMVNR